MYSFDYAKPNSAADAAAIAKADEDAVFLAGGMTLIPTMKQRLRAPTQVLDLNGLTTLSGIAVGSGAVTVGALTRHAEVAKSTAIAALAKLAGGIGDPAVRNRGTLGGSIANNDPAADYPAAVLALNATVVTTAREIAADDFFTGMFSTALEPGELITTVRFPVPDKAGYAKFPHPASRYVMAGAFVAVTGGQVRLAINGAGPCVFRWAEAEARLAARLAPEALDGLALDASDLNSDMHGSADYRAHLALVMAKRAVASAA
jgi:aerobic carbon-monoxide dehydrogenase medium subunit